MYHHIYDRDRHIYDGETAKKQALTHPYDFELRDLVAMEMTGYVS